MDCEKRLIHCPYVKLGCDAFLSVPKMAIHEKNTCKFKPTPCPRECGRVLRGDDVHTHLVRSRGDTAFSALLHKPHPQHALPACPPQQERCPYRFITCACGISIEVANLKEHVATVCTRRVVACDGTDWVAWAIAQDRTPFEKENEESKPAPDGQGVILTSVAPEDEPQADMYAWSHRLKGVGVHCNSLSR